MTEKVAHDFQREREREAKMKPFSPLLIVYAKFCPNAALQVGPELRGRQLQFDVESPLTPFVVLELPTGVWNADALLLIFRLLLLYFPALSICV